MKTATTLFLLASAFAAGCFLLPGPKSPEDQAKAERFDCEVEAVTPLVGCVLDAAQLMRDVYVGKADIRSALALTGASTADTQALIDNLRKCHSKLVTPAPQEAPAAETEL